MKDQTIHTQCFPNGLTLVVEPMADVQSAAFSMLVPAGSIYDPPGKAGCASVLADLITRGAGPYNSRELSAALDNLGVQRQEGADRKFLSFTGATLAENLPAALRIYADIIRRPHLPADQLEPVVSGAAQAISAIEDDPRQLLMQELRRRTYDAPWGLPSEGSLDGLEGLTAEVVRAFYERTFRPGETILGIAGKVDFREMSDLVEELFGDWPDQPEPGIAHAPRGVQRDHLHHESTQTQIGLAFPSVPYRDPDYYAAWAAVGVLSGGSSSRLFTEVRERRGLCYSVYAAQHSLREEARILCYAGSTAERAQQTLDVMLLELMLLWGGSGVRVDELERCKARAKSSLIMQQESSSSRASSIAYDWHHLGRVNTLDEVRRKIEALSVETVMAHIAAHPPRHFTILTLGPRPVEVSLGIS